MPYPSLLHPESLPLWQSTADPYLLRRHSNTVLAQSLWIPWVLVCTSIFEPSEHVWQVWGLILNAISPLLPSCLGFSFALGCGISPHSCSSPGQQLLQCLPSCRGFSVHGHGVSPHSCYSTTQLYNVCFMIPIDSHAQAQEGWNKPFVLREAGKQIQAGSSISTDTLPSANYQHWGNKI